MGANSFTESVWRRGWRDTKSAWTSWQFVILSLVVPAVIGGLTTWYWGLAIFGLFTICIWILATATAPIVLLKEARKRVREFEGERITRFVVKPCVGRRQRDGQHEHLMWAELQVTNTSSSQPLQGVEVRVVSCLNVQEKQGEPNTYLLLDSHDWNPTGVYWSERDAPPFQLSLTVPQGATRNAQIAFQDDSNGGVCMFNAPTHPESIGGSKIGIEISSLNSALWRGAFYIQCHRNYSGGSTATFEFLEWNTWTADHKVKPVSS